MLEKKYTYEDFLEIIKILRSENGCPWDREQTHMSLRPGMVEEAAEVLAAIRILEETGEYENLREELGDVMLQVVMHARIAEEEGLFTMEDVIQEVAEKMVRRHPHVFGEVEVNGSSQVLENWEEIKKREKAGRKSALSPLREIPVELPALVRAPKVIKKADKFYEPQAGYFEAVKQLQKAAEKLADTMPEEYSEEVANEVGDALMAISQISRNCKLAPELILTDRVERLIDKYEKKPQTQ